MIWWQANVVEHSADVVIPQPTVKVTYEPPSASDIEKEKEKKASAKYIQPGKAVTGRYVTQLREVFITA